MANGRISVSWTNFIADLLGSGTPIFSQDEIIRQQDLARDRTFTVCSAKFRKAVVAVKYFNFTAPADIHSDSLPDNARDNLIDASNLIRLMSNGVLRRCPSVATLEGTFFEADDTRSIRPAVIMRLACVQHPTLSRLLEGPQTPWTQRSLMSNVLDGLYALHSVRACHGDVKPENVLIYSSSANPRLPYQARLSGYGQAWSERTKRRDIHSAALLMDHILGSQRSTVEGRDHVCLPWIDVNRSFVLTKHRTNSTGRSPP